MKPATVSGCWSTAALPRRPTTLKSATSWNWRFGARTLRVEVLAVAEAVRKDDASAMYREL